jgi:hypothetical protein
MQLKPLLKAQISLAAPEELHEDARGRHRRIPITGGRFRGERLSGEVLAGGADWQVIRPDGVAELDARYLLKTDDGAVIYVHNEGVRHGPDDVIRSLAAGERVDPALYYMRAAPRFRTNDARYAWLNRIVCIATGARHPAAVELEVFEVL